MPREADVAELASFFRFQSRFEGPVGTENAVGVSGANDFMELEEVDRVRLQSAERFVNLPCSHILHLAVNLGHQENSLPVTIPQGLTHAHFAFAVVIVPTIIEKIDALIDGGSNDANALPFVFLGADMVTAQAHKRHLLATASQRAVRHLACPGAGRRS